MAKQLIINSKLAIPIATGLENYLVAKDVADAYIDYHLPEIEPLNRPRYRKTLHQLNIDSIRLPARINNPLIPYSQDAKEYILHGEEKAAKDLHSHHHSHLKSIKETMEKIPLSSEIKKSPITFDINILKKICNSEYSMRSDLINLTALEFAKRATQHDLSITATCAIPFTATPMKSSQSLPFLVTIHRLRALLARLNNNSKSDYKTELLNSLEGNLTLYPNYTYSYSAKSDSYHYCLIVGGGHFRIYHSDIKMWFAGTSTYLDYMFTTADIINNLDIITNCTEYEWAHPFFSIINKLVSINCNHNEAVDFMKNLEGFLLNISDYDEEFAMNWKPILESAVELWELDQKICKISYDFKIIPALLHNPDMLTSKSSILQLVISTCRRLPRTSVQELSSLHRFIFYAEVNSEAGVKKFLKRVHTPRKIDSGAIKNIVRLAKQLFSIAYHKRHNNSPNLRGDIKKVKLLQIKLNRKEYSQIETLPLSWWDGVELFNCMDNKLTNDALEFAKDKGALRKEIRFGPGDSRKELLQVIEQKDYVLKNFFAQGPFIPKIPKVYRCHHMEDPFPTKHPARLIPKEREQKIEARLFANGELSDKHALSLVTTRMKKALSYFSEQLMTPPDKKRKEIIHVAAQKLRQPDMYSLLLDIEGHNQSMQFENTSELSEFCGLLFGEEGWGDLPNYFSALDVFHYDEYTDDVILSQGQLGGIEGWLNPLWTLHTTLMMKLLRHMTDLEIPDIMVYSDDVDAIIQIVQASEETVQAVFNKVISHCFKFGMVVKFSQTTLSKHRLTILRQHYSDGVRADSTFKKLVSTSGANNPMLVSEEIEISGICSSIASALELSNHSETCCYLKNYKIGLLTARLPHIILSHERSDSHISSEMLPKALANLLYNIKDNTSYLIGQNGKNVVEMITNDVAKYLERNPRDISSKYSQKILQETLGDNMAKYKFIDSADRLLYLQIHDKFLQDLLFFWLYLPSSLGGLGAIFHINLILSGHSSGFSKSLHYLCQWIGKYSSNKSFFYTYLELALGLDQTKERNFEESRLLSTYWPSDATINSATTSVSQSIESMVRYRTKNDSVKLLMKLKDDKVKMIKDFIEIFRDNMHPRVCQFYAENTSGHFLDLLINKIETSSGLLTFIKNLSRLRNSLQLRMMENILLMSRTNKSTYGEINSKTDTVEYIIQRRASMFPKISFIEVDEVLYDDKLEETNGYPHILSIRKCTPMHYQNGIKVFDTPQVGNEARYKGEFLDDDRMISNKEEFMAAKLVAVTKWFLTKMRSSLTIVHKPEDYDCVIACNLSLSTLTGQNFNELKSYSPNETGGEILHRIPNIRFSTMSYLRSEMNKSLTYESELNQREINDLQLVDSNVNFDYLRLRFLLAAMIKDSYPSLKSFLTRYKFIRLTGIKDVQFVTPKITEYRSKEKYINYGKMRNHEFSALRFRYMVTSYLNIEELRDLSLIPNLGEDMSSVLIEVDIVEDLIYGYSRNIDKEYMTILPTFIDIRLWHPLTDKLTKLMPHRITMSDNDWLIYLTNHLKSSLEKRKLITTVSKGNQAELSLQNQCIESVKLYYPRDDEFNDLHQKYGRLLRSDRSAFNSANKLIKYQAQLSRFEEHRRKLSIALVCEYILSLHFKVATKEGILSFDHKEAINESINSGIFKMSSLLLVPDLQIKAIVLGQSYVEGLMVTNYIDILNVLVEISSENELTDIVAPGNMPNLNPITILTGEETISESSKEVEYEMEELPETSLAKFDELMPLCSFATKCVISGSHPSVFTSPTGSDSFSAQYGLYKMIKEKLSLDPSTRICDLTGGRGDFQYVCRELGLIADTYSKRDSFTQVLYHPQVNFNKEYDIRKTETLKFCTSYQLVHIDVSFTGHEDLNILDLLLFLESNNLAYTIRINSISLIGYLGDTLLDLPEYTHSLAYPMNRVMKPYQFYLVGLPGSPTFEVPGQSMKKTVAFRSIALSYARLLAPNNRRLRLYEPEINSVSIYLPNEDVAREIMKKIANRTYEKEKLYYSNRYINELEEGEMIHWITDCFDPNDRGTIAELTEGSTVDKEPKYLDYSESDVGNVSTKSKKYHVIHIERLKDNIHNKSSLRYELAHEHFLEYLRIHHPVQEVRTKCNVVLGLRKFNYHDYLAGRNAVKASIRESRWEIGPRDTLHQIEMQNAIKLLFLSAIENDYEYSIKYLERMINLSPNTKSSYMRVLKCYRLLSGYYDIASEMIYSGRITIKEVDSIRHELEVRESRKLKYIGKREIKLEEFFVDENSTDIIDSSLESLFENILKWSMDEPSNIELTEEELQVDPENVTLNFSAYLRIDDQVQSTLIRLGLSEPNRYGICDLDDTEPPGNWEDL